MHPYLRAYMAGIAFPTMIVPLAVAGLSIYRTTGHPFAIEDVVVFPIGLVPNAWGLWNMLYLRLRRNRDLPPGPFGAALVLLLVPTALAIQFALGKFLWTPAVAAIGIPLAFAAYYLAWKHVVSRLNDLVGIG